MRVRCFGFMRYFELTMANIFARGKGFRAAVLRDAIAMRDAAVVDVYIFRYYQHR